MKWGAILAAVLGLAVALYVMLAIGIGPILAAAASVGVGGFLLLCLYALVLFAVLGSAWYALIPAGTPGHLGLFIWSRMVRDSAGEILPFSQLGGILIGARALRLHGISWPLTVASTIVDVTTELTAQITYIAMGIATAALLLDRTAANTPLIATVTATLGFALCGATAFFFLQKRGFALAERLAVRFLPRAAAQAAETQCWMETLHGSVPRLLASFSIHLCAWLVSAGSVWLALFLMGTPITFARVVAIESLLCGIRSAAVVVPAALGVQEAAYAFLGPLFGLPAETAIAVSLLKRGRDIAMGIPVLLIWQGLEGGRLFGAKAANSRPGENEP